VKPFPFSSASGVVTGAASGIGLAISRKLAAKGMRLLLADRNEQRLAEAGQQLSQTSGAVTLFHGDLSEPAAVEALAKCALQTFDGQIDLLVNNAGIAWYGPTESMSHADYERLLAINLLAPIRLTQHLLPSLLARPRAHIVNVASIFGLFTRPYASAYHASKFGLIGYTSALRSELGIRGLGVTAVCPGFVRTNLYADGSSGFPGKNIPEPPRWLGCEAEAVAKATLRGIERNKRLVLVTPMARLLYILQRYAPWLVDTLQHTRFWHEWTNPRGEEARGGERETG
jgi:3-oxoacyl-[acyl-carrier protein] reductase